MAGKTSKIGRPTLYSPELAEAICNRIASGETLLQICRDDDMPDRATIWYWKRRHEEFFTMYARAKEERAELWADEIVDIADDGTNDWIEIENSKGRIIKVPDSEHINRSRLRVDTRKWLASKILPKQFGDKPQNDDKDAELLSTAQKLRRMAQEIEDVTHGAADQSVDATPEPSDPG